MSEQERAPETVLLRLSRYHCFLGDIADARPSRRVTSREIAHELGLSEETVRHDLKYVGAEGRPGAGYDMEELRSALQEYLDLSTDHPFIVIGNADILRGLLVTFPAQGFGLRPAAYFSERPEDIGVRVGGIEIMPLAALGDAGSRRGASLALVACSPEAVDVVLDALRSASVTGVLMLTPVLRPEHPTGMNVTYFRMPCALKALAASVPSVGFCCETEA
jgi:NADH/NAD ratio-sensing transcriptional regulator Rex